MAIDLFFGKTSRNWARRDQDRQLTSVSVPSVVFDRPYEKLAREALTLDSSLRVRPSGRGAVATKVFKWG